MCGKQALQFSLKHWLLEHFRPKNAREKRAAVLLVLLLSLIAGYSCFTYWSASSSLETAHFLIFSSATKEQTEEVSRVLEDLFTQYQSLFGESSGFQISDEKLKMKLYKDRNEFKRVHPLSGWAEGFYRPPYSYQYYSASNANPYHWMVHEATHQLNHEVAHFNLPNWAEEGFATYMSTSKYENGVFRLGDIDPHTYPIWWLSGLKLSGSLDADYQEGKIIPLEVIFSGTGGPSLKSSFNLYYIEWWSVVHFFMHYDNGRVRDLFLSFLEGEASFEILVQAVGSRKDLEQKWYSHLLSLIDSL